MTVRLYEWDKTETGWAWIEITDNKVVNLILRELNNLIKINDNNEVYTDLQLDDNLSSGAVLPVWVTTGRVLQANWRPVTWTLISSKTTSGDNIKILYWDDGEILVDNGTWIWKNITTAYFKTQAEYDSLPARKNTDGNLYIIVDSHLSFELIPRPELRLRWPSAAMSELNQHPDEYLQYYEDNERASKVSRDDSFYWSAVWGVPWWEYGGEDVIKFDPSQTEQERRELCTDYLISYYSLTEQQVEDLVAWLWISAMNPD